MPAYATRSDVYVLGLTAQAFVVRPRVAEAIEPGSGTFRLTAHGLTELDMVTLAVVGAGQLPTGTSQFAPYYPIILADSLFQLAETRGGSPLTFASAGSGAWGIAVDHGHRLDANLADTAAVIDEHLTAHETPLKVDPTTGLYPPIIVGLNARMAARRSATTLQFENPAFRKATDRIFAIEKEDLLLLADWKAGKPISPRPTDQDDIADNAARAGYSRRAAGWSTGML